MKPKQIETRLEDYLESDARFRQFIEEQQTERVICDRDFCKSYGQKAVCYMDDRFLGCSLYVPIDEPITNQGD